MLVQFLKKESATRSLADMLSKFDIIDYHTRPVIARREVFLTTKHIKEFAERWVKTHREQ